MKKIILASGSPRRRELMMQAGLKFQVYTSKCREDVSADSPSETAALLSELKCRQVADSIINGTICPDEDGHDMVDGYVVIGADTIVVYDDMILGKPKNEQDARAMLTLLSGKTHTVYTGVTVIDTSSLKKDTFTEHTEVTMYDLTDEEILDYIHSKEPMDKAGAYGIQGRGALLVREICGDYYTVVGLPIAHLIRSLREFI